MSAFQEQLRRTVLRLDGATGTEIQRYTLAEEDFRRGVFLDTAVPLKGDNECLNLTRPDVITAVHEAYIAAGADIIETNTFSANRISQKEYGLEAHAREMALAGARIARAAADKAGRKVWVAGSIGPTSKSLTLAPDIARPAERPYSFDEMAASYREQVEALIEGGVDLLLIETAFDALNVKAALYAVETRFLDSARNDKEPFPVIVSVSVGDKSGRTLTGQTLEAFYTAVRHYPLTAFGVNCSLGADGLLPLVKDIASFSDVPVICYPNAGLPNELGGYDQTPAQMAAEMARFDGLLNIAGGCCGTTPEHIKALPELSPAPIKETRKELKVSGLEAYLIDTKKRNFTLIGERTNVAGSRKFARLVAAGDYDAALEVAANQIEGGADIIDINMDDAMLDGPVAMETFVRTLQNDPAVAKAALMIDSSHWECILAGLKNAQGKCIVNSISLKDLPPSDRHRHPGGGSHFRRQCPVHRHGHPRARPLRDRFHRSRPLDQAEPPRSLYLRRHLQPLLCLPGQQSGAQRDARRIPVPRHPRGPGHGHRQSGDDPPVRRHRTGTADGGRGPHPLPGSPRDGKADGGGDRSSRRPEASSG